MRTLTLVGRGPNTMSLASLERFEEELEAAGGEPLLVTGQGSAFSAGLDLDALGELDPSGIVRLLDTMERVVVRLFLHPAPTVAWVNGHAVAGGCLVVQACDVRLAAREDRTRIGMTGVAVGLRYPPFAHAVLGARVPSVARQAVLMGARLHGVGEALELGLLDELVEPGDQGARARAELEARAGLDRRAYAAAKQDLRGPFVREALGRRAEFEESVPSWTAALRRR